MPRRTDAPTDRPYLTGVYAVAERVAHAGAGEGGGAAGTPPRGSGGGEARAVFPFSLPWVAGLDLDLDRPVTFLVGENGSGKSTLLEALAELCGLPAGGGGRADLGSDAVADPGARARSRLASVLRPRFRRRPRDGFFFRAETFSHFASLLEARQRDPDFKGDPYGRYGGRSLHTRSHGEAFLSLFNHRVGEGLYLLDEPEAALSPQRQVALGYLLRDRVRAGGAQFIIATHAPILLTFPGAVLLEVDHPRLTPVRLEDTSHYQITRGVLTTPGAYWRE